jgi:hypothetical protein
LAQQSNSSYTLYVQQYWGWFPDKYFKGQAICAFVSLKGQGIQNSPALVDELKGHIGKRSVRSPGPMKSFLP